MTFIIDADFKRLGVVHGFFDRTGGVSLSPFASRNVKYDIEDEPQLVAANRKQCLTDLGVPEAPLVFAKLCHGNSVHVVRRAEQGDIADTDALITNVPGVVLGLSTADCLPILVTNDQATAVGIIHAGWRGLTNGVIQKTIEAFAKEYDIHSKSLYASIGPAISQLNYEVGREVAGQFDDNYTKAIEGRLHLDIIAIAERQLKASGVQNVNTSAVDVYQDHDFYSYRRDQGKTGRQMSAIALNS